MDEKGSFESMKMEVNEDVWMENKGKQQTSSSAGLQ